MSLESRSLCWSSALLRRNVNERSTHSTVTHRLRLVSGPLALESEYLQTSLVGTRGRQCPSRTHSTFKSCHSNRDYHVSPDYVSQVDPFWRACVASVAQRSPKIVSRGQQAVSWSPLSISYARSDILSRLLKVQGLVYYLSTVFKPTLTNILPYMNQLCGCHQDLANHCLTSDDLPNQTP